MKFLIFLFSAVLSVLAFQSNATPWGLPGDAVIRTANGKPSICVPENSPGSVSINSISVSESIPGNRERQLMWQMELEQGGSPQVLSPGDCVSYGDEPPAYQQRVTAKSLQVGDTYYARMNIIVANPVRQSLLFYDAVFCVVEQQDGMFTYPQYRFESDGSVIKPSC